MNSFSYVRAGAPAAAMQAFADHPQARFLAGGTTLIDLMKLGVETPATLIDIRQLPLAGIEANSDGVRIGALVSNTDLAYHAGIQRNYPALSQALLAGASTQLRNMASVGGNLLQRTRCTYFRDTHSACNKRDPGSGCAALQGFNRSHALLGTSEHCIATHPSDMCVALTALDAVLHVQAPAGERRIPITDFYVPYGADPARETILQPGELIVAVELPAVPWFVGSHYLKVRDRASYEFALSSAAVALDLDADTKIIRAARVALGGVGSKPWRSPEAETVLTGAKAGPQLFQAAADAALKNAVPRAYNRFKIALATHTLTRALTTVAGQV